MEILGLVLLWPLLVLVVGLAFISASSVSNAIIVLPVFVVFLIFVFGLQGKLGTGEVPHGAVTTQTEDLDKARRGVVAFSIALFLPIFVKYLLSVSGGDLTAMILALVFGFAILIWGMFVKDNRVLTYANIIGGAFVIIYLYFQLWSLGQLAQVIATAFGLVVAVAISIIKFREKLI
jgi:hypothetical protein